MWYYQIRVSFTDVRILETVKAFCQGESKGSTSAPDRVPFLFEVTMGVERVDYYDEDEYQQALQQEEVERYQYEQEEEALNDYEMEDYEIEDNLDSIDTEEFDDDDLPF